MSSWSWSWSSSSSSCPGAVTTKIVRTTDCNGQVVTKTFTNQPEQYATTQHTPQRVQQNNSAPAASSTSASGFEKESLDEHNRLRALHGAPPLTLNRNLCAFATEWANYLASRNLFQHRTGNKYGENLFMSSGSGVNAKQAVKSWYDEISMYNYSRPGFASSTGHFTQVVWKGSTELGVGYATRGNSVYVVANYNPPGNMQGSFPQNVSPPCR